MKKIWWITVIVMAYFVAKIYVLQTESTLDDTLPDKAVGLALKLVDN